MDDDIGLKKNYYVVELKLYEFYLYRNTVYSHPIYTYYVYLRPFYNLEIQETHNTSFAVPIRSLMIRSFVI